VCLRPARRPQPAKTGQLGQPEMSFFCQNGSMRLPRPPFQVAGYLFKLLLQASAAVACRSTYADAAMAAEAAA
jgi:hypothetical protein